MYHLEFFYVMQRYVHFTEIIATKSICVLSLLSDKTVLIHILFGMF